MVGITDETRCAADTVEDLMGTADVARGGSTLPPLSPGYRAMLLAMLVDALAIVQGNAGVRMPKQEVREARDWIDSDDGVLPFPAVCWAVGLDADAVRRVLRERQTGVGRRLRPVMAGDRHSVQPRRRAA